MFCLALSRCFSILAFLVLICIPTLAVADDCYNNLDCCGKKQCGVAFGECNSPSSCDGDGPCPDVCVSVCEAGRSWRFAPQVGLVLDLDDKNVGWSFALETAPPIVDGRIALSAEYWTIGLLAFGGGLSQEIVSDLSVGLRLLGTTDFSDFGRLNYIRVEYAPLAFSSLILDFGENQPTFLSFDNSAPFLRIGVSGWF